MGALVAANLFPNCFEKAKVGGHFLFFGQIALTFIKCSIVALAHNGCNKKRGFVLRFNFAPTYPAMFFITCYMLGFINR